LKKPVAKSAAKTVKKAVNKAVNKAVKNAVKKAPQSMPYEQGKWAHVFSRAAGERRYWLIKSEPDVFSFDDLQAAPRQTTGWDSVRNSTARNFLRDGMKRGDLAFYYHSNAEPSAIVGICEIVREGYPDTTAFDKKHEYYDAGSDPASPTWFAVDVRAVKPLARPVTLPEIKADPMLSQMVLVKLGRLSVVPVSQAEWDAVIRKSQGS
jgi:predicted RNA-binding protein with PUA-like domain